MDMDEARLRQALMTEALSPVSTFALEEIVKEMRPSELRHLRKVYKERSHHVTRVAAQRIAIIERALGESGGKG